MRRAPQSASRATRAEMDERHEALLAITAEMQPMTVRQVFYQASVRGIVDKTEAGYGRVQRALVDLRRAGRLPFDWIADNARWQRKPTIWRDPAEAVRQTARFYRKALWADAEDYVEVWLEKDALSAVVYEVTAEFDVPLMVARGYASLSFLHEAAEAIAAEDRPAHIYHLGDFDPSGVDAADKIEETLREFAPRRRHHTSPGSRCCRTRSRNGTCRPGRPSRPTAASKGFGDISVELDAIDARQLRGIVRASPRAAHAARAARRPQDRRGRRSASFLLAWAGDPGRAA